MEIIKERNFISRLFWKERKPFTSKRDLNIGLLVKVGGFVVGLTVLILLLLPSPKPKELGGFNTKTDSTSDRRMPETTVPEPSLSGSGGTMPRENAASAAARGFDVLSGLNAPPQNAGKGGTRNLNSSMILSRQGTDSRTQLPPGSRFAVRITQNVSVGGESMPVIGEVSGDVLHDSDIAIPRGSRILGDVTFDDESERARLTWKSIIFPDGRQRDIAALGMG
ncbi:hypothetical protein WDW37_21155, partial [Bdellovibrionota bacterium FG-1]